MASERIVFYLRPNKCISAGRIIILSFLFLFVLACNTTSEDRSHRKKGARLIFTSGKRLDPDSVSKPVTFIAGVPQVVPAKPPKVTPFNFNMHAAGKPRVHIAGEPQVNRSGIPPFSLPKVKIAVGKVVACGTPQMIVAKDAASKDVNPANFSFYKTMQGLNRSGIYCMLQDRIGNIWLGTSGGGLSRFDGKFFTNFTQKEGLQNVSVSSMIEDRNGNFWLGTDGGGVTYYDGKFFTHFDTTYLTGRINSILEDETGNVWFGTNNGVFCYERQSRDGGKARFINFTVKEGLAGNEVYCIIKDKKGKIWLGTNGGVSCYDEYSKEGNVGFKNFTSEQGLVSNKVKSILEDKTGNLWFGTDEGASCYNGNNLQAMRSEPLVKTFTNFTEKEGLSNNKVSCMLEDEASNIWFGTDDNGLSLYQIPQEGREGCFINFTEQEGLVDNRVSCILKDNTNNLLFGTLGGVCIYYGKYFKNFTEKEGLASNNIFCMLEDKAGLLWFGTYGNGVCCFDKKVFTNFTTKEGLIDDKVFSILEDKTGKIWIGTSNGLSCYERHPKDGGVPRFTNFTKQEGLVNNQVVKIHEDKTGKLWFCTRGGVSCYEQPEKDGGAGRFTNFTDKEGLAGNDMATMMEDKTGKLWFGTYDGGVLYYNGKSFLNFTTKEGLATDIVQSLLQDKQGNIWLGTSKGLSKISSNNWEKLRDKNNNFNPVPEALFHNYEYNDGFIGVSCLKNSVLQDRKDRIWWGSDILTCYIPQGDEIDTSAPNIQLTGIKLFGQEIPWSNAENGYADSLRMEPKIKLVPDTLGNGIALHHIKLDGTSNWYNVPENLYLACDNNSISFNFIGVHMQSRNHIQYKYQLQGLEDYWSVTENTEVAYSNLPSGDYSFIVKAMNQSGTWSEPIKYKFTIEPPWVRTAPAITLFVLISIGIIYLIINYFNARTLKEEQKKLKILVEERTSEVVTQKNKAEKLLQVKENFLSNMSHEIRTPLNAIIGYTDLSLKEMSMAKMYKYLRSIKVSSDHLHHLVDNILDLAKMESDTLTFLETNFDLEKTLEEVKHLMHFLSLRRGNSLNIMICKPASTWVFGDREKLLQVLLNLIDNAIKFTENGKIDVRVELVEKENNQVDALFCIKDTGIGISGNKLQSIFESFTQADNTITRTYGGTGLGLTICKKIIELQGGEINVISTEKQGSQFSFRLPYLIGKKQEIKTENFQATTTDLKGYRILVAEDDSVNEELLRTILNQWGLAADFAENGEKLMTLLKNNTYNLILMDIHMPGMSGVEVAAKIRNELEGTVKDIPIIALTADVLSSTKEKIISSGINNVLYKPIDAETLYLSIASELGLKAVSSFAPDIPLDWEIKTEKINLEYLIESCGQNKNQLLKILSGSFEKLIEYNVSLATAYREQDFDQLYFIAHKLGSILKILGILELDPRLTQLKERIHSNLTDAEEEMQDTITYVDTVIKKSTREIDTIIEFISKN